MELPPCMMCQCGDAGRPARQRRLCAASSGLPAAPLLLRLGSSAAGPFPPGLLATGWGGNLFLTNACIREMFSCSCIPVHTASSSVRWAVPCRGTAALCNKWATGLQEGGGPPVWGWEGANRRACGLLPMCCWRCLLCHSACPFATLEARKWLSSRHAHGTGVRS